MINFFLGFLLGGLLGTAMADVTRQAVANFVNRLKRKGD